MFIAVFGCQKRVIVLADVMVATDYSCFFLFLSLFLLLIMTWTN